ncbi:SepM family pheromone-processing serine protease [Lactobacillus mulieris]|uniref:endopeptidase La n=1 Tax=Lactobacillus mulieris TaxID=2508708 RepID=A0AAW5WYQ9_9LACO|nr:SepM family pheromone-processing serine protease [Lactobacillus mulieris]MCZ3622233.1 PDZ domain-containing protein [Lactobacillus mulieris]MCZ3623979.1 PDZ domain-containing protein [Lactobacillus mulieris]MCZ3636240.1 PDZ domain-containing protein [Lactobacillus mulieris]MCZ3689784.1 PDZ domain-containing protein [Lactobacillus mulieris]MCZ3695787.1 PDZ domain-containing protein [Lactobacillus mulieris]
MKNKKKLNIVVATLLLLVLVYLGLSWPTNYYIEAPGDANSVSQFVSSKGKTASKNFLMVTVSERQASLGDYLWSYTNPFETRISQKDLLGNQNTNQYMQLQEWYMETSQNNAIYYAAKVAGKTPKKEFLGVYVMGLATNSKFKGKLEIGDIITEVDGQHFKSTKSLMDYIQKQKISQKITITVQRNNKSINYTGKTIPLATDKSKAAIGIQLVERSQVITDPQIKINAGSIGGPSAGLMFSLASYQLFTGYDLTHGVKVAGTGTIDDDGNVGMIGGVDKKVVAADKAGAKVFFAPSQQLPEYKKDETNYAVAVKTAKQIHSKMKIVPVATFNDALNYLKKIQK